MCLCANALLTVCAAFCLQVWMPEPAADGSQILTTAGLPFAVVGVDAAGTLLALFRCVSVRYRFTTDVHKPALMGAIGRVFVSKEVGCTGHEFMRGVGVCYSCLGRREGAYKPCSIGSEFNKFVV